MDYYCYECRGNITEAVFNFSKDNFGNALCRQHQNNGSNGSFQNNYYTKRQNGFHSYNKQSTKCPTCKREKGEPTPQAKRLGELLNNLGWKVEFEKCDGYKHIDIAIVKAKFNIEVDGSQHNLDVKQASSDLQRTFHSFDKGYETIRIPNLLVSDKEKAKETANYINLMLNKRIKMLDKAIEETRPSGLLLDFGNAILKKLFR